MAASRSAALAVVGVFLAACAGTGDPGASAGGPASSQAAPPVTVAASPTAAEPLSTQAVASQPAASVPRPTGTTGTPPPAALAWAELRAAGERPAGREDHTWTLDGAGEQAYLFGGRSNGRALDELWRYDLAADSWTRLAPAGSAPTARFGHVAVWLEGTGLVVWSGQAGSRFFTDLWAYDPAADGWHELAAEGDIPPARYGSCGAIGPDGLLWISHGFTADGGRFSDTRTYDFATGRWTDVTPAAGLPVRRCLHDCLWTPDGRFLLYAGQTTGVPAIGDLWAYRPADGQWAETPRPEPVARQLYALAAGSETALVFGGGGADGAMLADLWQLQLADLTWTRLEPAGARPAARSGATLLADPRGRRFLLFGGTTGEAELDDLWTLEGVPDYGY